MAAQTTRGRAVLLLVNTAKHGANAVADRVAELAAQHGRVVARAEARTDTDLRTIDGASEADLVVVIGGDGTLLNAARRSLDLHRPILGVDAGNVGFLSAFEPATLEVRAAEVFGGADLPTHTLCPLVASITRAGRDTPEHDTPALAINEFVVAAGPPFRMITLELSIAGARGPRVSGDGVIIATPTGSTAYNISAGGPILSPGTPATVITPIAAHSLSFRPIVVPAETPISITVLNANDNTGESDVPGGAILVADGQGQCPLHTGDRVDITTDCRAVQLVADPDASYWDTLMRKMGWASRPVSRHDPKIR